MGIAYEEEEEFGDEEEEEADEDADDDTENTDDVTNGREAEAEDEDMGMAMDDSAKDPRAGKVDVVLPQLQPGEHIYKASDLGVNLIKVKILILRLPEV